MYSLSYMSSLQNPAADAAVVCLRVLRRLLQDEEVTLAQLSYVIENLHDPLAERCVPPSQRPILVTAYQSSSTPTSVLGRFTSPNKHARSLAPSPLSKVSAVDQKAGRLPPQPAVVEAAAPVQQLTTSTHTAKAMRGETHKRTSETSKGGGVNATRPSLTSGAAARAPLTFSQYWDIFANLSTLHTLHFTLVQQLETIIQRLAHIVEELQPATRDAANSTTRHDASTHSALVDDTSVAVLQLSSTLPSPATAPNQNLNQRKQASALRRSPASAPPGPRSVYNEIGVMVCDFFGSELMKHFMAEHMMYAVKYTERTAPQLLRLSRLWRWSAESSSAAAAASPLAHLREKDQKTILENRLFLDFLWRSFGHSGVPADSRVCIPASPEPNPPAMVGGGGQGQVLLPIKASAGGGGGTRRSHPSLATGSSPGARLPPIPAMWTGFRTFLMLLATPLNVLRRYSHVARCLLESGALLPKDCERLQSSFVDVAALRMAEETNLVMEKLCLHDVRSIMALMDMPGARSPDSPCASANGKGSAGLITCAPMNSGSAGALAPTEAPVDYSNRALIHYGRLLKRFGRGRHERLAFLFSDWMCYAEEKSNGRFRVRGTIPLTGLRVIEVRESPSLDTANCFEFILESPPKRITFYAASPEQRDQWVDAIRYTVRRFCERQKHEQAVTGDGGMPSGMRPTAPVLMFNSRLSRQRRHDSMWQEYVDHQRHVAAMALQPSSTLHGADGVSSPPVTAGSVVRELSLPVDHSSSLANISSGDPSHDGSLASRHSSVAYRQLDYDVTPWSQRASVHRRIRSQELIAVHQQQLAVSPLSHIHTPTISAFESGAAVDSNADQDCIIVPSPDARDMGSATSVRAADRNTPPQQQQQLPNAPALLSISLSAVAASTVRLPSASTPLRRPVSERFDAVEAISEENLLQHQHQEKLSLQSVARHANSNSDGEEADVGPLLLEGHHKAHSEDREMILEESTTETSDPFGDYDQRTSLALPHPAECHATVAPLVTMYRESFELDTQQEKEEGGGDSSSSSTSKSAVLDSINDTEGSLTPRHNRTQNPSTPSLGTSQGLLSGSVLSTTDVLSPAPVIAQEEVHSCDTRPVAATDHSECKTGRIVNTSIRPVKGGVGEGDETTTVPMTAPRSPGLIPHRPITPMSLLGVVVSSPAAAAEQECDSEPVPLRAIIDSSAGIDSKPEALMGTGVARKEARIPRYVDPVVKRGGGEEEEEEEGGGGSLKTKH
ncbi:hypothetical protein JKF63_06865 [Porcisia hertigi]|uniref:PH domain-containing protein n=1 Tax=Porcisia hertigi TaxID=2761500 RepID=A0A836LJ89_9TRYP|nr:hypothetical protein JKF63_06865 [Porcisia hertigi]